MAVVEGARRVRRLGTCIAIFGSVLMFLIWAAGVYQNKVGGGELVLMLAAPLALGGVIRIVAWLLEGFLLPAEEERKHLQPGR